MKPGPKKGYKQSDEHRKRISASTSGERNHGWKGDRIQPKSGRSRAQRLYPNIGPCHNCGNPNSERHHLDGNPVNNAPENIVVICRRCHMLSDGRLGKFKHLALSNLRHAGQCAAEKRRSIEFCPKGHHYSGQNLYINPRTGSRSCRACLNEYKRNKRRMDRQI